MQKGFAPILVILLVTVLAVGGFFAYQNFKSKSHVTETSQNSSPSTDPTASWKIYRGDDFSFRYPSNFLIKEDVKDANSNITSVYLTFFISDSEQEKYKECTKSLKNVASMPCNTESSFEIGIYKGIKEGDSLQDLVEKAHQEIND